jgi:hypothetical protein
MASDERAATATSAESFIADEMSLDSEKFVILIVREVLCLEPVLNLTSI